MSLRSLSRTIVTGALATGGALGVYATAIEPHWLQVTRTRVPIPALPHALDGLRVAVLSDFHVGGPTSARLARRACSLATAERPDLIAVTGDLLDDAATGFAPVVDALRRLDAPLGVYAVPGNYEHVGPLDDFRQALRATPHVTDLTGTHRVLHVGSARLALAGVDDLVFGDPNGDVAAIEPAPDAVVALAHRPEHAARLQQRFGRVDLVLSGHTHGGQVRLPGLGAVLALWRGEAVGRQGLQRLGGTPVYVTRGIGTTHLRVRLFCRPEVALLDLRRA